MLLRVIGLLIAIEAGFMVFPLVASVVYSDGCIFEYVLSIIITLAIGISCTRLQPKKHEMGKREAIMLTVLTWVILSIFGMLPFLFTGSHLSVTDAFFESMNGFTTTGASVFVSVEQLPKSVLLWRSIQQWIGGMGIILFTLAVVPMLNNQGGMMMFNAEVTGITHDKLRPRVSSTAKGLWLVYTILTVVLIILLSISKMNLFEAICHGLSIMSTGGFSTQDMSIEAWNSIYVKVVVIVFMTLGGINFALLFNIFTGHPRKAFRSSALRWYLGAIFIAYILLSLNLLLRGCFKSWEDVTIDPLFQAASIFSSTGISEPDFHDWGPIAIIVLVAMMFVGGCAGSTSGGAKIDRIIILLKFIKNEFYKLMHPSTVTSVNINGRGISYITVQKVLSFLCLYVMVVFGGGILLVLSGIPLKESFFYCLSAISNTGISSDIVGIGQGFIAIPDISKWILAFIMLVGRLEIYTVLLIFTPVFWKK